MMPLLSRNHILLMGLCSLLVVSFAYEAMMPLATPDIPPEHWRLPASGAPLPIAPALPSVESFASMDARPLFNPARRAIQAAPAAAATALQLPMDITLIGVIIGGDRRVALLHKSGASYSSSVQIGMELNGWQIEEIEPDRILLRSGSTSYAIPLSFGRSSAPIAADGATVTSPDGARANAVNTAAIGGAGPVR